LVSECEKTGEETPIIRSFGSVWDNGDALQMSFLKNPKNIKLDGSDTGLDFEQVQAAFEIIKKLVRTLHGGNLPCLSPRTSKECLLALASGY
jgi:hypothetical protein